MIGLTLLGATGSIGRNTLDVVARHPARFRIVALTAQRDVDTLHAQCVTFQPDYAVMADAAAAAQLSERLRAQPTQVLSGVEGLQQVATLPSVAVVMAAIIGAAGLLPTLAAVEAGKRVLLANKEALVMAGSLFMEAVHRAQATLLPIDSEHNAIFQCLPMDSGRRDLARCGVRRILLTCSGGPFRTWTAEQIAAATPEQAVQHPQWQMGRKISVDSATLMNKGLEVIEAHWLFNAAPEQIEVVIHPQSVIHSLVEYVDGSILAQLGHPDMRTPIAQALAWPDRMDAGVSPLNLFQIKRLEFEPPDTTRFPCLALAFHALQTGGLAPTVLNAANEVAVQAFLAHRIGFHAIPALIEHTLTALHTLASQAASSLEVVLQADAAARDHTRAQLARYP